MLYTILLIIGFVLLIAGAHVLVNAAVSLAHRFRVSSAVIGLTVVAFGTSFPELVVNIIASIQGEPDVAFGNIIGSNIYNGLFIIGFAALITPILVHKQSIKFDMPVALLTAVVVCIMGVVAFNRPAGAERMLVFSRLDGIILLAMFALFMFFVTRAALADRSPETDAPVAQRHLGLIVFLIVIGLAALIVGGRFVVNGAVGLADVLGIPHRIISLTVVAIGTSLPELAVSAVAAYKKQSEIALNNVVGSNIFNVLFIFGLSSVIRPVSVSMSGLFDLYVHIGVASLIMVVGLIFFKRRTISRPVAVLFLVLYILYVVRIFMVK